MNDSENGECMDLIRQVWQQMNQGGTQPRVLAKVLESAPSHLDDYVKRQGWKSKVQAFMRSPDATAGLPRAPLVDDDGLHMQLELMSVEEHRYVVRANLKRGGAYYKRAQQWADRCAAIHGVQIDLATEAEAA